MFFLRLNQKKTYKFQSSLSVCQYLRASIRPYRSSISLSLGPVSQFDGGKSSDGVFPGGFVESRRVDLPHVDSGGAERPGHRLVHRRQVLAMAAPRGVKLSVLGAWWRGWVDGKNNGKLRQLHATATCYSYNRNCPFLHFRRLTYHHEPWLLQ